MAKFYLSLLVSFFMLAGCKKDSAVDDSKGVWIRIENASGQPFDGGQIAGVNYGTIAQGATTVYKQITAPIYGIGCQVTYDEKTAYAGVFICGTPMPPPISAGYYTLKIMVSPQDGYFPIEVTQQ